MIRVGYLLSAVIYMICESVKGIKLFTGPGALYSMKQDVVINYMDLEENA